MPSLEQDTKLYKGHERLEFHHKRETALIAPNFVYTCNCPWLDLRSLSYNQNQRCRSHRSYSIELTPQDSAVIIRRRHCRNLVYNPLLNVENFHNSRQTALRQRVDFNSKQADGSV